MSAQNKSVFELFDIISNDGVTTVDLVSGVISFIYYRTRHSYYYLTMLNQCSLAENWERCGSLRVTKL